MYGVILLILRRLGKLETTFLKKKRVALKELKNSNVVIRIQDKGSRFVLIDDEKEYEEKIFGHKTIIRLRLGEHW